MNEVFIPLEPGLGNVGNTQYYPISDILSPAKSGKEPGSVFAEFPIIFDAEFKMGQWDAALLSQVVLAEFSRTSWHAKLNVTGPPTDVEIIRSEIETLAEYASVTRRTWLAEIIAHSRGSTLYFANLAGVYPNTRPASWTLILAAYTIGQMVAMHYKYKFRRARPVQLYPALLPAIDTPQHPSYPSSHAIQTRLAAELLSVAQRKMEGPLVSLATKIAHGREVAGLHYPSDTKAGIKLAVDLLPFIKEGAVINSVLERARTELQG